MRRVWMSRGSLCRAQLELPCRMSWLFFAGVIVSDCRRCWSRNWPRLCYSPWRHVTTEKEKNDLKASPASHHSCSSLFSSARIRPMSPDVTNGCFIPTPSLTSMCEKFQRGKKKHYNLTFYLSRSGKLKAYWLGWLGEGGDKKL